MNIKRSFFFSLVLPCLICAENQKRSPLNTPKNWDCASELFCGMAIGAFSIGSVSEGLQYLTKGKFMLLPHSSRRKLFFLSSGTALLSRICLDRNLESKGAPTASKYPDGAMAIGAGAAYYAAIRFVNQDIIDKTVAQKLVTPFRLVGRAWIGWAGYWWLKSQCNNESPYL